MTLVLLYGNNSDISIVKWESQKKKTRCRGFESKQVLKQKCVRPDKCCSKPRSCLLCSLSYIVNESIVNVTDVIACQFKSGREQQNKKNSNVADQRLMFSSSLKAYKIL